ncbi:MAG: LytR C-terminal domain-containing protein [Actinobacteria bacterium]|nr:LytR C-terminal domain-containing protein [Actinomycetota bacterium]
MSHNATGGRRRQLDRIAGATLALIGVAVLVVALLALRQPKGREAAQTTVTVTSTTSAASTPTSNSAASSSSAPASSSASHASSSASAPASSSAATADKSLPLLVLNNTNKSGLAETAANRFRAGGWTVSSTGNLDNDIASTCAYYDPSVSGAQAAATALQQQFPSIKRVKPKFSPMPAGPIVVVLATDYS